MISACMKKQHKLAVEATYFLLVLTIFYNMHHKTSREFMKKIIENGRKIGQHFIFDEDELKELVNKEAKILSNIIETKIEAVSMHRLSEKLLSLKGKDLK